MFTRQTLLKHKYTNNVTDSVFIILGNIPILLVLALDSEGIIANEPAEARRQGIVPREGCCMQKNSRSTYESVRCKV